MSEQFSDAPEIPGAAEAIRLQFGRIAESSDEMRIDMLIGPARAVQVAEQPHSIAAADDLSDHRVASRPTPLGVRHALGSFVPA
ncbi:MAG: hypothetical protein J2P32_00170 [Actinobacteria bacterium]|nr:hypothetical protein [Actinomycetota bacterium]